MNKVIQLLNNMKYAEALQEAEKHIYLSAYKFAGGNQSVTARLLGVARGTVINKLRNMSVEELTISAEEKGTTRWR